MTAAVEESFGNAMAILCGTDDLPVFSDVVRVAIRTPEGAEVNFLAVTVQEGVRLIVASLGKSDYLTFTIDTSGIAAFTAKSA